MGFHVGLGEGMDYNISKAIFYLLKGGHKLLQKLLSLLPCILLVEGTSNRFQNFTAPKNFT